MNIRKNARATPRGREWLVSQAASGQATIVQRCNRDGCRCSGKKSNLVFESSAKISLQSVQPTTYRQSGKSSNKASD